MLEILFDILFVLVMFFSFVSISASLFGENKKGEKIIRILDFIMLIFMSAYIIKSLNPFNPDKLAIFVLAVIFTLILFVKNIFSLKIFINVKCLKLIERKNQRFLSIMPFIAASSRCDENGNVIFGKTRLLTDLVFAQQEAVEEKLKRIIERNNDFIDELATGSQPKTIQEKIEEFKQKFSNVELRCCPICNSPSALKFDYWESSANDMPGAYRIFAKIGCVNCGCGLCEEELETNIYAIQRNPNRIVEDYIEKWNFRRIKK